MVYSALDMAKYVINYCVSIGRPISNLQLQKILYFVQGEYFRRTHHLIIDDNFKAWSFGPVISEVYDRYCVYGGGKIYERDGFALNESDAEIVDQIISDRSKKSAYELVEESHAKGLAWDNIYNGSKSTVIPKMLIMRDFDGSQN